MQHIAITVPGRPIMEPLLIKCDLSRAGIALAVEALIAKLDAMDGDTDIEPNGDEGDGTGAEDDFAQYYSQTQYMTMPGCPLSDEDGPDKGFSREHRDYIRATRCDIVGGSRWHPEYRLRG